MVQDFVQSADLRPQALGVGVPDDLKQGDGHREDHEHVNHLHVGSGGKAARYPDMAGKLHSRQTIHLEHLEFVLTMFQGPGER